MVDYFNFLYFLNPFIFNTYTFIICNKILLLKKIADNELLNYYDIVKWFNIYKKDDYKKTISITPFSSIYYNVMLYLLKKMKFKMYL
jgi:hypothetical protein